MLWLLIIIFLIPAAMAETNLTAGTGFSRLEQRFVLFEQDTISASNEGKFFIEGSTGKQYGNNKLKANAMLSAGTETFWGRTKGAWDWTGPNNLKLSSDLAFDVRQPYDTEDMPGYFKVAANSRIRKRWSDANGSVLVSFEDKKYTSESSYSYDYSLSRVRFDFGFPFIAEKDEFSVGYQFAFRYAPDTTGANYQRNNFYLGWQYFTGGHYYRADFEAERRVYNRGDLSGNHWRMFWDIDPRIALSDRLTLAPRFTAESYRYDLASSVYPNRDEYSLKAGAEWAFSPYLYCGLGPKFMLSKANLTESDNYNEYSLELSADWLKYRKIWVDFTLEPGVRSYSEEPAEEFSYYSNYAFVELNTMVSWWIKPRLRVDLIAMFSPEWHNDNEDDITTTYLSANLKYDFISR